MHVGLNPIYLVPGQTGGMEVYARELAPRLAAMEDLRVTAFVNREAAGEDFGCEQVVVSVNATDRMQWVRGEQLLLPGLAEAHGCDLVHSLGSTAPIRGRFAAWSRCTICTTSSFPTHTSASGRSACAYLSPPVLAAPTG